MSVELDDNPGRRHGGSGSTEDGFSREGRFEVRRSRANALHRHPQSGILSQRGFDRAAKGDAARAQEMLDTLVRSTPVRRIGVPADIAGVVTFLASSHASFITGVTLPIDGGRSAALL